jgi:Domain of unknown function (DUF4412)
MIPARACPELFWRDDVLDVMVLALALGARPAPAGLYFEQTTTSYADGQPLGPGVRTRVWHAGGCLRLEAQGVAPGPAFVLCSSRGRAFRLDPERKVAVELDVGRLRERSQADAAVAAGLMGGGEEAVRTIALDEHRHIAGYDCRGFRLDGPSVRMVVWVAEGLPVGVDAFTDFLEWSGAAHALGGLLTALRGLPGFPLETRTTVDVFGQVKETVSTVTLIRVGAQPSRLFEVPVGWSVVSDEAPAPEEGEPR